MTKRDLARLESILESLDRSLAYIDKPSTFIACKASHGGAMAFSRHVTQGQVDHVLPSSDPFAYVGDQHLRIVNKEIGSDFALVRNARRDLAQFLEANRKG